MRTLILQFLLNHWPRKLVAVITAVVVWILVNNSITTQKTIPNVPVRVINIPPNKTISGLLPTGTLSKRVTLTLTGIKTELEKLQPGDLEIVLDAANKGDEWVAEIGKRNLVSLNPEVDLLTSLTEVTHSEFVVKLSRLVTERIPVRILRPIGEPPKGYQFLGVWPSRLVHTLSGPEEQIEELKNKGFEIVFDLGEIRNEDLDPLEAVGSDGHEDEVRFYVPAEWRQVAIPFLNYVQEGINDPEAKNLHLEFVRKELLPLNRSLPITLFFPRRYAESLNPDTITLAVQGIVKKQNGIEQLGLPLYARNVSRLFLDVVRDWLQLAIVVAPKTVQPYLDYSIQVIDAEGLEDRYVARLYAGNTTAGAEGKTTWAEDLIRKRFREYLRSLEIFHSPDHKLNLNIQVKDNLITISTQEKTQVVPTETTP